MAMEINDGYGNGDLIESRKPTKYTELVGEYIRKQEQLKQLQKEVDELGYILDTLDKAISSTRTPVGNYTSKIDVNK